MGWLRQKLHKKTSDNNVRRRPTNDEVRVFSYYARSSTPARQNTGRREMPGEGHKFNKGSKGSSRVRLGQLPGYIALVVLIVTVLYAGYLQPNPKVVIIKSGGTIQREPKEYQAAIGDIWEESLLNQTKFTIPTGRIRNKIESRFKELGFVQIELPLIGRRPVVILTPDRPALQIISNNGAFYVNFQGEVMAHIGDVTQDRISDLPVVRDESGVLAEVGKNVLSVKEISYIIELYGQLKMANVALQSITLPSSAAQELDIRLTGEPYYIKFSFDTNPRQAVGSYLAAIKKLKAESAVPGEYMDVRVEEKVFYK